MYIRDSVVLYVCKMCKVFEHIESGFLPWRDNKTTDKTQVEHFTIPLPLNQKHKYLKDHHVHKILYAESW